jgi:bis(5'-nucleosyl)-tetraphosphatase (symmetrical)
MATYAIGDVQGCFEPLERLLAHIQFDATADTLWFAGDLINRGLRSLDVLRFVKNLGSKHKLVLGNHDLHLLAVAFGAATLRESDTLSDILSAPDRGDIIEWLRHQPLLVTDNKYVMTHAGLAPMWTVADAILLAREVETVLQSERPIDFLAHMYGNQPDIWDDRLTGTDRLRCIVNYFTRMRLCHLDGRIDLSYKGAMENKPADLVPWFDVPKRVNVEVKIIFGHWAALNGRVNVPNVFGIDTGCVWGNCLTAMRLEDEQMFQVKCG